MNNELRQEIKKMIRQEFMKLIPEFFGRSLVQLKNFFTNNIT